MPAVTVAELQAYIGTDETGDFIESCLDAANAHVGRYIGDVDTVPNEIHRQAIFICASELFHRRSAPQGIAQFATNEGTVARVSRDPMIAVYPLLLPYVGFGV